MLEVSPGLLLGSEGDAMAVLARTPSITKQYTVTHILTISNEPLDLSESNAVLVGSDSVESGGSDGVESGGRDAVESGGRDAVESGGRDAVESGGRDGVESGGRDAVESGGRDSVEAGGHESVESGKREDGVEDVRKNGVGSEVVKVASLPKKMLVKFVCLADMPESDLLHHFLPSCQFIQEGLRTGGTVLVHCVYGISRSVTMVIAYQMWSERRSLQVVYDELKKKKPEIRPNPGFLEQLKLWEAMRCCYDTSNKKYKAYHLKTIARDMRDSAYTDKMELSADPSTNTIDSSAYYRCRKCRRLLFTDESVLPHEVGKGEAAFKWYKRTKQGQAPPTQSRVDYNEQGPTHDVCSSWFIEPVQWMESSLLGRVEGKILCLKCSARLGSFNWSGDQCSCGQWVTPSFQIHKARIDETRTLTRRKVDKTL